MTVFLQVDVVCVNNKCGIVHLASCVVQVRRDARLSKPEYIQENA